MWTTTPASAPALRTGSEDEAIQIVQAKNQAERQPILNLQIAKAYLAGSDNGITTRTWQHAIEALTNTKQDANKERWLRVVKDRALMPLLPQVIIETKGESLLKALHLGTVSTNVYLRRLHNFCVDMNWLPWPLIPKRQWPAVRFKDKRAITWDEHCKIVARELNPERKAFYQLAWHLGASQSDLAHLQAEDVDWQARIICFVRMKTRWRGQQPPQIRFGKEVEEILATLPQAGPLFPYLANRACRRPGHRVQATLCRSWHSGRDVALLPVRLGGTREDCRLSRTVRATGLGSQQQGRASGVCEERTGDTAPVGRIRAKDCAADQCGAA